MGTVDEIRDQVAARNGEGRRAPWLSVLFAGAAGAAGAALAYLFDPDRGRARRAVTRDRVAAMARRGAEQAQRSVRRASSQAYGMSQKVTHLRPERSADDLDPNALARKVESAIYRHRKVPKGQINVNAEDGTIVLRGQVESNELIAEIEARARGVHGVSDVNNMLHLPGLPASSSS